jgi:secreted Zn-dependent insulinase-like peptidase
MKRNRIFINAYGYNDTLHLLIEEIINKICSYTVENKELFEIAKIETIKRLENIEKDDTYTQSSMYFDDIMLDIGNFSIEELLLNVKQLEFDDLVDFIKKWLVKVRFEWFFFGNIL